VHNTAGFSSLEEHVEQKKQDKIRLKIEKDKTKVKGLTAEGRKKISDRYVPYCTNCVGPVLYVPCVYRAVSV
jgi:hypothetical protein